MVGVANDLNDIMLKSNFHTGKYSSENVRIKVKKYLHLSRKNPVVHTHKRKRNKSSWVCSIEKVFSFVALVQKKKFFFAQFMSASINDVAII